MNRIIKYFFFLLLFLHVFQMAFSQDSKSEEELKDNAKELFYNQEYGAALKLYSQLLSLYPKDPNYSYRFGACKLFTEKDKEAPLTYLEFGASDPNVEPEAHYFLAKAYHLNYRFEEALASYNKFEEKAEEKSKDRLLLKRHIQMCQNGQKLLKNITDIIVLDKKKLTTSDFFRNYNLAEFGGKIIKTPDEFKLAFDIKKGKESIMYLQPNAEIVYFSSYGADGKNGKDIYFSRKTPDGDWGKPQILAGPVNTEFDEDYAFFHPNGTLYFSSTGHNSMGGYDVFKSTFDEETQQWSYPQNIDFAINTPGDDYLYITDLDEKNAYFSSNRESSDKEVTVYRVKVDRIPVDIALIKGNFTAASTKSAKITIEDLKDGKIAGVYNTNATTGDYVLTVPNGGKFKFIVETPESPVTYTGMVDIPRQKTLKTLKQEMQLSSENEEARLIIKNMFDEEGSADVSVLLAEIYKEKAALEINADEIKADSAEEKTDPLVQETTASTVDSSSATAEKIEPKTNPKTNENISNDEIIKIAKEDAKNIQQEASDLRVEKEIAYSIANEKNRLSNEKASQADELTAASNASAEPSEKQQKLEQAKKLKRESKLNAEQAVAAHNLAKEIEKAAEEKQKEADIAFNYAQELENAIQQNSPEATAEKLAQLNQFQEKQKNQPEEKSNYPDLQKQIEEKKKESDIQTKLAQKLSDDVKNLESDISTLQSAARAEKKKKDKERLEEQASILERDLPAMQSEAFTAKELAEKTQKELQQLEKQESILNSVVTELKSSDKSSITSLNETDKSKLQSEISSSEERIALIEKELANDIVSEKELVTVVSKQETETKKDNAITELAKADENKQDIDTYYRQKIEGGEAQSDPVLKEENKAKNYEEWAAAIEKESADLKQKAALSTDENEKLALNEKALNLENSAKEKRELATKSQASAQQLRTADPSVSNKENTPENYDAYYTEKLAADEVQGDDIKKETTRAVHLGNWAKALEKDAVQTKLIADTTTDEVRKTELNDKALALENAAKEKRQLAQQSQARAEELSQVSSSVISTGTTPENYQEYYAQKIQGNESERDIVKKEESKARDLQAWADAMEKDVIKLKQQADTTTDPVQKSALNEKATTLERQANEKKELSRESQATAAQLRLAGPSATQNNELNANSNANAQVDIASYSEKYIATEKKALSIQNEKDKAVTLAEINREWANDLSREITSLEQSQDTISEETKRNERKETIRLLTELKKEKETKAQQYTESALEAASKQTTVTAIDKSSIPEDYNPWFESKLQEQQGNTNALQKEEAKANYYDAWAESTDREIQQLRTQSDSVTNEEEKRSIEDKIVKLEIQSKEKRDLSEQSRAQAQQLKKTGESTAMTGTENNSSKEISFSEMSPEAQHAASRIEAERLKQLITGEKKYQLESYNNMLTAIDKSMENSKSLTEMAELENQKKDLQSRIQTLNNELARESETAGNSETAEVVKVKEMSQEKIMQSEVSAKEADSLSSEALVMNYQADKMGIFRRKKKEELQAKAKTAEQESQMKRLDSDLAAQSAKAFENGKEDALSAYSGNGSLPSEKELKKGKESENEAVYLSDQAKSLRENALTAKKKKEKKRLTAEADSLDHAAAMKRKEAQHNAALAEELKKIEKEAFIDVFASAEKSDLPIPGSEITLTPEEAAALKDNADQQKFTEARKKYKKLYLEAEVINDGASKMKKDADAKLTQFTAMIAGVDTISDEATKSQLLKDAMDFLEQTKKEISKSDSIAYVALVKEENARFQAREAIIPLMEGDKEMMNKIFAYQYYKPPVDSSLLVAAIDSTPKDTLPAVTVPVPVVEETFTISANAPVYNDKNPIPLNPKYPDGLVWQVQIGAFRNPIPQDLFKGFAPIMGVKVSDGITRYSAGLFKTFSSANDARNQIVKMGYKDAFVVVYRDGQRISVAEARRIIAQGLVPGGETALTDISVTPEKTVASGEGNQKFIASDGISKPVSKTSGLFYTVQIGVYSKPATAGQLMNVQPVNSEELANGTLRYSSGVYRDFNAAVSAKNIIVEKGIKDAFVCAYNEGKRISIAEAKKLIENGTQTATLTENPSSGKKVSDDEFGNLNNGQGVVFRVKLGSFTGEIPIQQAGAILEFTRKNSKQEKDANGNTVYLAGIFKDFNMADNFKSKAISSGLKEAVVVAFKDGVSIELEEAKKVIGANQ